MLVSEIVLCIKEVNKRTRVAAYELLVGLANAMHDAEPPPVLLSLDAEMGEMPDLFDKILFVMLRMVQLMEEQSSAYSPLPNLQPG